MKKYIYLLLSLFFYCSTYASVAVYSNGNTSITGTWNVNCTINSISTQNPFEGGQHYSFSYSTTSYWAGAGLNCNNWNNGASVNFSGNTHLRIAVKGNGSAHSLGIMLRTQLPNGAFNDGPIYSVSLFDTNYNVYEIPLFFLTNGSSVNLDSISEIDISVNVPSQSGSGVCYVDDIQAINKSSSLLPVSSTSLSRRNSMKKGFNASNWLDAYWMIPFNAYPVANEYTFCYFKNLKALGFDFVRLPVIFERLGSTTPPYALNTSHPAFAIVDSVINWCNTLGLKCIIDNHHPGIEISDSNYSYQIPRISAVWKQLISRYSYLNPDNFFFELQNEANKISNPNLNVLFNAVVDTIRRYNNTHTLIIGATGYNSANGLASFEPVSDSNTIYTFHSYDPYFFTHQGMTWTSTPFLPSRAYPLPGDKEVLIQQFYAVSQWDSAFQQASFLGEFGAAVSADDVSRCNYIEDITNISDSFSFPWTYWDTKSVSDGFGIFKSGVSIFDSVPACISSSMGLLSVPLSVQLQLPFIQQFCKDGKKFINWSANQSLPLYSQLSLQESLNQGSSFTTVYKIPSNGLHQIKEFPAKQNVIYRIENRLSNGEVFYSEPCFINIDCIQNFSFWPNPAKEIIYFSSASFSQLSDLEFSIFDCTGKCVQKRAYKMLNGSNEMNVSDLPSGLYSIQIISSDIVQYEKFVKE
jgi:endoglucanase